jgi:uncharacterized membrane protein (DUF106 family)
MVIELIGIKLLYPVATAVVTALSLGISLLSSVIHRKLVNKNRMDEIRGRIEGHQKRYLEAQKKGDKKEMEKLEKEQAEILGLVKENMMASMKPSLYTMPVVLAIIWGLGYLYGRMGPLVDMPFAIPFITKPLAEAGVINGMDWFGLYLVLAIGSSLILELVLKKVFKV